MRGVWLAGGAALALLCALGAYLAPLQPNILALQFAFTPRAFGEVVHQWTGEPLHRFRMHLVADYALLVSYGLFGYLLSTRTQVFLFTHHRHLVEIDAETLADLGEGCVDCRVAGYIALDNEVTVDTRRQRFDALLEDFARIAKADFGAFTVQRLCDTPRD